MSQLPSLLLARLGALALLGVVGASMGCEGARQPRTAAWQRGKAVIIPIRGSVEAATLESVEQGLAMAKEAGAAIVVLSINTLGGELRAALDIADAIRSAQGPMAVAYVDDEAISAGAVIALACSEIVMNEPSMLGDCAVVEGSSGEIIQSERVNAPLLERLRALCAGKYPRALVDAMVSPGADVWEVETLSGKQEYLTGDEFRELLGNPSRLARYKDARAAMKVAQSGRLLTMNDTQARRFGFSQATVKSLDEVLERYGAGGTRRTGQGG